MFLRNPTSVAPPGGKAYAKSKTVYLLGQDRRVVVAALLALSFLMLLLTGAVGTIARTLALAGGSVLLHASLRSPNLKARLNSYNEEFRRATRARARVYLPALTRPMPRSGPCGEATPRHDDRPLPSPPLAAAAGSHT